MDARLIYVFGTGAHATAREQLELILRDPDGTRARDVGVVDVDAMPQVKLWYDRFDVADEHFRVVLLDVDGAEVWRGDTVTQTGDLWAVIDALPSRRDRRGRDS
jgi:uncharacterized protein DUF4174